MDVQVSRGVSARQIFVTTDVLAGLDAIAPEVVEAAARAEGTSPHVLRAVLRQLGEHVSWEHGDCYPSQEGLALDLDLDPTTVRRGLDGLERLALVARHRGEDARLVYGGGLDGRRLAYTLTEWRARRALRAREGAAPARMRRAERDAARRARRKDARRRRAELERLAGLRAQGTPELPVDAAERAPRRVDDAFVERLLCGRLTAYERSKVVITYGEHLVQQLERSWEWAQLPRVEFLALVAERTGQGSVDRIRAAWDRIQSAADDRLSPRQNPSLQEGDPDASGNPSAQPISRPVAVNTGRRAGDVPPRGSPKAPQR